MRRGAGILLGLALAVGLVVLLPAAPAAACSCVMPAPVDEALLERYDVAFTGVVTANEADADMQRRDLEVAVDEVFLGEAEATQQVVTHAQSSACGTDPAVGSEVLFLMVRGGDEITRDLVDDDELVVMSCGGDRAATEAAALGSGRPPEAAPGGAAGGSADEAPAGGVDGSGDSTAVFVIGAVVVAAAVVAVLVVVRRRRAGAGSQA